MPFLKNAKISTKVLSVIIPLVAISITGFAFMAMNYKQADTEYSDFITNEDGSAVKMALAGESATALSYAAYQILTYRAADPEMAMYLGDYDANKKLLIARLSDVKSLVPEKSTDIDAFLAKSNAIIALTDQAVKAGEMDDDTTATADLKQVDPIIKDLLNTSHAWLEKFTDETGKKSDLLTDQTNNTIFYTLASLTIAFILGIGFALFVAARGISSPIAKLRERMASLARGETDASVEGLARRDEVGQMAAAVAVFRENAIEQIRLEHDADRGRTVSERERIEREAQKAKEAVDTDFAVTELGEGLAQLAAGNVTYRIDTPFVLHLDQLRRDFNGSMSKLNDALKAIGDNARGIDAGATEIRAAADDLSKRTEQQAASVEQTAAALEQITTTVKDSTRRAEDAGQLVARAKLGAENSGNVMREAVAAMEGIEMSSNEISNIIGVIDEIAFQTNLLALNAGVEAARAGEAGKGFAVVAQEVRELAQRSAKAAKEIKTLISTSSAQVRNGVELVARTGQSLIQIVKEVDEIDRNVHAIVEAAREQSVGLAEINTAVNTIDQGTQQNAAMVEESTAASHSLAQEVSAMNGLLKQFDTGEGRERPRLHVATERNRPITSPARSLGAKVAGAFNVARAPAAVATTWEDF